MVISNVELMHECFPKHSNMGTVRIKKDKETQEEGIRREAWVWKLASGHWKKKSLGELSQPNQYKIIINIIW